MFNIEAEKFQITYHRESTKIAPSTREYVKPSNWNDKGQSWSWSTDLHQSYQVDNRFTLKGDVPPVIILNRLLI